MKKQTELGAMEAPEMEAPTMEPENESAAEGIAEGLAEEALKLTTADLGVKEITDEIVSKAWNAYLENCRRQKAPFHLQQYVPVNVRILAFRRDHPLGLVYADLEETESGVLGTGYVYLKFDDRADETRDLKPAVTEEFDHESGQLIKRTARPVFAGKWIARAHKHGRDHERAETGAIGRALGMLGYGAVAAIASPEDIEEEEDRKARARASNAELAEGFRRRQAEKNNLAQEKEQAEAASSAEAQAADLRKRLIEYVGRKRIYTLDDVEAVFGEIASMDAAAIKDVGRRLKAIKTRAAWEKLQLEMGEGGMWEAWPGGTALEQLKGFLFACVAQAPDEINRKAAEAALDAANDLLPFDDVESEARKIVAKLSDVYPIESVTINDGEDDDESIRKSE